MKNIKSSVFALFGAAILSVSFFSCSNDDVTTTNNMTEQNTMAAKTFADIKIIPALPGFGLVSSFAGPCVSAPGFCIERTSPGTSPIFGIGRLDNTIVRLTMSMETYKKNKEYFVDNIFEVGNEFSLNHEISKELGFETETVVTKQTAKEKKEKNEIFYIDLNVKRN